MKKIFGMMSLLAVMVAMVGMVGCNSNKDKIVGEWKSYEKSRDGKNWRIDNDEFTFNFLENGTVIIRGGISYSEAKWNVEGDKLTIVDGNETGVAKIEKLTDDELVIREVGKDLYEKFKRVE